MHALCIYLVLRWRNCFGLVGDCNLRDDLDYKYSREYPRIAGRTAAARPARNACTDASSASLIRYRRHLSFSSLRMFRTAVGLHACRAMPRASKRGCCDKRHSIISSSSSSQFQQTSLDKRLRALQVQQAILLLHTTSYVRGSTTLGGLGGQQP